MPQKSTPLGYAVGFVIGLTVLTATAVFAFWQVTGSEVRRSARDHALRTAPPPPVVAVVDTSTPWAPAPEDALLDTVFTLRSEGRLGDALTVLERWLQLHPDDVPRRLDGARLAFEARRRDRGVFHYRRYLQYADDRYILGEAIRRFLTELPPAEARAAVATLLPWDDDDFPVRIGLARATAEASDFAGADSLLAPIPPQRDPAVDALRLQVRRSIDPDIPTAVRWVEEYPGEVLYRLVLARSLGRAGRHGEALPHYLAAFAADTTLALREEAADVAVAADSTRLASELLAGILERDPSRDRALLAYARARARLGDAGGAVEAFERLMARDPDEARFAEARGVLFEVNDVRLTLPLLRRLVAFRPDDDALRLRLAQDLEQVGDLPAAEAQYDTLLVRAPSAPLQLTRARVRLARNDLAGAFGDAAASERREPSVDAALMQGDIHRWRQERDEARLAYDRAARLAPADPRVNEGRRLLAAARRDALGYEPAYGTSALSSALGDSDGFEAFTLRAQHGFAPFAGETMLTAGGEVRRASGALGTLVSGIGGDLGVVRTAGALQLTARAGALAFEGGAALPAAHVEVLHRTRTRSWRGSVSHAPAYESLRSAPALDPADPLMGTTLLGSVSAQLAARLDLYVQLDHTRLADGNGRSVGAGALRWQLGGPFALLYTASGAAFDDGTTDYWSPRSFVTQGLGLDARRDRPAGWSVGARLAPAFAWSRETAPGRPAGLQSALQATLSADATWRAPGLEVGLYAGFGQDRAGTYSAGFGGLRARMVRR